MRRALERVIAQGYHTSACTPKMTAVIIGDLQQRLQYGLSILLPVAEVVRLFGGKLKLSRIAAVSQEHRKLRLILNLTAQPDKGKPSVNETTAREIVQETVQFVRAIQRTLQVICEADQVQGPV